MRIPAISLQAATLRSMPSIDPTARVQKRMAPEGVGKQRSVSSAGRQSAASLKSRSRKPSGRGAWDGLGQEVDVLV